MVCFLKFHTHTRPHIWFYGGWKKKKNYAIYIPHRPYFFMGGGWVSHPHTFLNPFYHCFVIDIEIAPQVHESFRNWLCAAAENFVNLYSVVGEILGNWSCAAGDFFENCQCPTSECFWKLAFASQAKLLKIDFVCGIFWLALWRRRNFWKSILPHRDFFGNWQHAAGQRKYILNWKFPLCSVVENFGL